MLGGLDAKNCDRALGGDGTERGGQGSSDQKTGGIRKLREASRKIWWVLTDAFLLWVALESARAGLSLFAERIGKTVNKLWEAAGE